MTHVLVVLTTCYLTNQKSDIVSLPVVPRLNLESSRWFLYKNSITFCLWRSIQYLLPAAYVFLLHCYNKYVLLKLKTYELAQLCGCSLESDVTTFKSISCWTVLREAMKRSFLDWFSTGTLLDKLKINTGFYRVTFKSTNLSVVIS